MQDILNELPYITGDESREAIDSLKGYVYQIYQSALAWVELQSEETLYLEVAEDFAVAAKDALNAVQVKGTKTNVTINSKDIVTSIDSFVSLKINNPNYKVKLRHLTTSTIGKEKSTQFRIGQTPTLETWRKLAKSTGDLTPLRQILSITKISDQTKNYIEKLNDLEFREEFLKKIHFDCGAPNSEFLLRHLKLKLLKLVKVNGGIPSQVDICLHYLILVLLKKSTQQENRFVDRIILEQIVEKVTRTSVNTAQYDKQLKLLNQALSPDNHQHSNIFSTRLTNPRPLGEVPLPTAIANRSKEINKIISSIDNYGISWIFGSAGVGKTTGAKIAANRVGGNWASINLRNLKDDQVCALLSETINFLTDSKINGLLVDDLVCNFEPHIEEMTLYLLDICNRTDVLLMFTSPRPAPANLLFKANLSQEIHTKIKEFTEQDIGEILNDLNIDSKYWAKYIHLISGGGHPQLTIAAIQNLQNTGWDRTELRTLKSLMTGNSEIEYVRATTRERLLRELPKGGRTLLQRLSLRIGSFNKDFVLNLGQLEPKVPDCGILFDQLIGSWIDQQAQDSFSLSPLLSNFAQNTLANHQTQTLNYHIADILMTSRTLNPIEMDSALFAAWLGKNDKVILNICMATLTTDSEDLKKISSHLIMFRSIRTDSLAYVENPELNQLYRGVQLLLVCYEKEGKERIQEVLKCFDEESELVKPEANRNMTVLMVYTKLLMSDLDFSLLPDFLDLILKLYEFLENKSNSIPPKLIETMEAEIELQQGVSIIGYLFLNQVQKIKLIEDLIPVFSFLSSCSEKLRQKLLKPFEHQDFDVDLLVTGAWLNEHNLNTITPSIHSNIFEQLESISKEWDKQDFTVACRKFRVIIIDEYGEDKDHALKLVNEGLKLYGETNSELIRAKSKVLYRAGDHQNSFELSKKLIESDAPLNDVEKTFLSREAAISAEKQGDYESARKYYILGSVAAEKTNLPNMEPMRIGLLADAALASWHSKNRVTCLLDFITVLNELKNFDPNSSLRAAHCHNMCRHTLLWLDSDTTGKSIYVEGDDSPITVYPGIHSNPEPHPEIAKRYLTPLGIAWYMLAIIENHNDLDVGVNKNLDSFLPEKKPIIEGQMLLLPSLMERSLIKSSSRGFVEALGTMASQDIYILGKGSKENSFNLNDVTYGRLPIPSKEQKISYSDRAERYVISFISICIFKNKVIDLELLVEMLKVDEKLEIRENFLRSLETGTTHEDYLASTAALVAFHNKCLQDEQILNPKQNFEFIFRTLQIIIILGLSHIVAKLAFDWIKNKWAFIITKQRFLLKNYRLYEKHINCILNNEDYSLNKLIDLLLAILPTIGISNESDLRKILNDFRTINGLEK